MAAGELEIFPDIAATSLTPAGNFSKIACISAFIPRLNTTVTLLI
jgi:hypothetical protein